MPKGRFPHRRTLEYLSSLPIFLKNSVKAVALYYDAKARSSSGARYFMYANVPQLQYKNPQVQFLTFKNEKPTPFLKIFFGDGQKVTLDVENKSNDKILEEIKKIAAKPETQVRREQSEVIVNVANFKQGKSGRRCMCEVPGQVPCPKLVPIPNVHHSWHNTGTETAV